MEALLLVIAIVILWLNLEEHHDADHHLANHSQADSQLWQVAARDEGRIRQLTDQAVLDMMNELRRSQAKEL